MSEIVVLVEGETEQDFVASTLAAHFGARGTSIWPILPGRHGSAGGVKRWAVAEQDIVRLLKSGRTCTTMFDYYRLPANWPGRTAASQGPVAARATTVEAALHAQICAVMGSRFNPRLFIPYVQLHEFEALLFAEPKELAYSLQSIAWRREEELAMAFQTIRDEVGDPEAIDDGFDTCPSRRIQRVVAGYRKRAFGPLIAERIGIERLRAACAHFSDWIRRLEEV